MKQKQTIEEIIQEDDIILFEEHHYYATMEDVKNLCLKHGTDNILAEIKLFMEIT